MNLASQSQPDASIGGAVDCHAHLLPPAYVDGLSEFAQSDSALAYAREAATIASERNPPEYGHYLLGDLTQRGNELAKAGIAIQVISSGSSLAFPQETTHRAELVSLWNDSVGREIQQSSDSFLMFASVPLPDVDAAVREVQRVALRTEVVGFSINTHILGMPIDDDSLSPLFDLWNEIEAIIFVHPDRFCVRGIMAPFLEVDIGTQFDDTLAAARLMFSGVHKRYPHIRWIISHLGGTLPFVLGRMDEHWRRDRDLRRMPVPPSQSLDGLYFDTAGHDSRSIGFAIEVLGSQRLVLGSDFPAVHAEDLGAATRKVMTAAKSPEDIRRIMSGTSSTLSKKLAPMGVG